MRFAIIWTWQEPRHEAQDVSETNPLEPKQRVGYFCTFDEAVSAFAASSFGEKELVVILQTGGKMVAI